MTARTMSVGVALLSAAALHAQEPIQLDESCTVTVGNQTAIVRPDGTFLVRNISVFASRTTGIAPQLYRVRATCFRDGDAITGQSEFFSLTPGQTTFIADVLPSALDPIPVRIAVTSPVEGLGLDETAQLTVTAFFPDGSTEDVTPRSKGTTYLSSNPNLLTVSDDGLVTGRNDRATAPTVTVAVLNEGNVAGVNLFATGASDDFDNDGMPNDYEDLFGLDKFVNDSFLDLDLDGLTNLQEFNLGTLPNNPDTDADGIPDGQDDEPLVPDETPPVVTIVSPAAGAVVLEGETVDFSVNATDNGLLTRVDLSTDTGISELFTAPPFRIIFPAPRDVLEIVLQARAVDSRGNESTATRVLRIEPSEPPTVTITAPSPGDTVIEGAIIRLAATATDDVGVARVEFSTDAGFVASDDTAPYEVSMEVPLGRSALTIDATAFDASGRQGFAPPVVVTVIPDPLTTVIGLVLDPSGFPVLGAALTTNTGQTGASGPDGSFSIPDVPTVKGDIVVTASADVGGDTFTGVSAPAAPVAGGTTDVGTIELSFLRLWALVPRHFPRDEGRGEPRPRPVLILVDPVTGAGGLVTPVDPFGCDFIDFLTDMVWSPDGSTLMASMDVGIPQIVFLDPTTGTVLDTVFDEFAEVEPGLLDGLVFSPGGDLLGAFAPFHGELTDLVLVDIALGAISPIGPTGFVGITGLAFNDVGDLFGVTSGFFGPPTLLSIDPATGAAGPIGVVVGMSSPQSLVGDTEGRLLAGDIDGSLYELDPATGIAAFVGPTDFEELVGLSLGPPPEATPPPPAATFTTVEGLVTFDDGTPAGATLSVQVGFECFGELVAETAPDGTFSIINVPATRGLISVFAEKLTGAEFFFGEAVDLEPVPDGVTDAGTIVLLSDGGPVD